MTESGFIYKHNYESNFVLVKIFKYKFVHNIKSIYVYLFKTIKYLNLNSMKSMPITIFSFGIGVIIMMWNTNSLRQQLDHVDLLTSVFHRIKNIKLLLSLKMFHLEIYVHK